jgi:hypothetical protein
MSKLLTKLDEADIYAMINPQLVTFSRKFG